MARSPLSNTLWRPAAWALLRAAALLDRRTAQSVRPFTRAAAVKPRARSRIWAWKHYGVFLPDLPEPWRYLNTMTFIGSTGTRCFDNETVKAADCRRNATVLSSTAHGGQHHYQAYDIDQDCDFPDDGSLLRWGEHLTIRAEHPRYTLSGRYDGFSVDVELETTAQVSWFVDSPVYRHLSLLAPYRGTISDERGQTALEGVGTVEYACCVSPQSFRAAPLPWGQKLPADFFTYQIVPLQGIGQLLLTDVRALGLNACRLAYLRAPDGGAEVFDDVRFEVVEWAAEALADPSGNRMRVPVRMRWRIAGAGELEATVDSPWRYGHGNGYVAAYRHTGTWRGAPVSGSGYCEWVDVEDWGARREPPASPREAPPRARGG